MPVQMLLAAKPVVVVGGGTVATRKVDQLLAAGAVVTVVAPVVSATIADLAESGRLTWIRREVEPADLADKWFVVSATGVPAVAAAVYEWARSRRVWINTADVPEHCDVFLMSSLRRGQLLVGVGTAGTAPAVAVRARQAIEAALGPEWAELVDIVGCQREAIHAAGNSTEQVDWRQAPFGGMLVELQGGRSDRARELLELWLSSPSA